MESLTCLIELETMGKEMLKKCGGLPLAIVVLGGLLATKKSWNEWEMVQKNINLHLNKFKQQEYQYGGVNGVLALSYNELPFHLKPCFLYFGHYQEDSEISTKELIRLWIAEGFVSPSMEGEEMIMEDVGEQYLGELMNRCLVQVGRRDHTGTCVKTCRIHDLLRDLCVSKAREESFFLIVLPPPMTNENKNNHSLHLTAIASTTRRIAVHPSKRYVSLKGECPNLRSLLLFQDEEVIRLDISKCSKFRFLRVLKILRKDSAWSIPSGIGDLFHLRYLAIQCSQVILPPSIGNLNCLHTLSIAMNNMPNLPRPLFNLERLRHLLLFRNQMYTWHRMKGCRGTNSLQSIETLKFIKVSDLTKNKALLTLTNIRSLGIELRRSEDVQAILRSPTFVLSRLRSLHMKLIFVPYPDLGPLSQCHHLSKLFLRGKLQTGSGHVLDFLPKNIAKLTLVESRICQDPMPVLEKLPHLRSLCFDSFAFVGTKFFCSANGFPQLDYLEVKGNLEEWQIEEGAMPQLRILKLEYVKLKIIPEGLKSINTLQEMELYRVKKSLATRIQVIDGTEGEDYYKVSHIPSIKIVIPQDD